MYSACWPASFGKAPPALLPSAPSHAAQTWVAIAWPLVTSGLAGVTASAACAVTVQPTNPAPNAAANSRTIRVLYSRFIRVPCYSSCENCEVLQKTTVTDALQDTRQRTRYGFKSHPARALKSVFKPVSLLIPLGSCVPWLVFVQPSYCTITR